ncbi:MAG: PAS domain S-box protein, partial [Actinobacteria bacterium]|nr:PAS domain S-box protein [Actinomycetota bacterium]
PRPGGDREALLASLLLASPAPLIGTDLTGVITEANPAAGRLLGRPAGELAGTRLSEHFADPGQVRQAISEVLAEGAVTAAGLQARRGTRQDEAAVSLSAASFPGPDGKPAGLVISLTDLSERNLRRDRLRGSEAFYRGLIEATADGLAVLDPAGRVAEVNRPACDLLGYPADELAGAPLAEHFDSPSQVTAVVRQALAGQQVGGCELGLAAGNGRARQLTLTASAFRDPRNGEQRVIVSLHDTTEQAVLRDRLDRERAYQRSIIESSANGLVMTDLQDRVTDVNETICRMAGRDRERLLGSRFDGLFTDPGAAAEMAHGALAAGRPGTAELRLASGGQAQVIVSASVVRSGSGAVTGVLISARDISEQIRLRRDLAAEKGYNRRLIDSSPRAIFVLGRDARITDVSAGAMRLTGHPRGRLLGRPFPGLFADSGPAAEAVSRAFASGRLPGTRLPLTVPGQPRRIIGIDGGMFTDPRGGVAALLVAARDVTAETQTEERLRYYSTSLLGAIVDAFATTDPAGVIEDVNEPMAALTGRSREDLVGSQLDECFTEPERAREFLGAVLRNGKVADYELTVRRPDGTTTAVSYSAATFTDSQGKLRGLLASGRDVTDRRKSAELQASLLARARELDEAKNDFVSRISHELRAPLTSVLGYLELMVGDTPGPLTGEQRRMLEVIGRNGRRLLSLIEDLLLVSRIEGGRMTVECGPVRVDTLIRSVHESFRPAIENGRLSSRLRLEAGLVIEADQDQLERAVANLLSNAVKFTPPGGRIEVTARRAAGDVMLQVRDTGIGVPADEQPRLFNRFFRSAAATERETQGTGLGLFIVKHVAEAHGGSVTVSSVPGAGSTFTIRLPGASGSRPRAADREVPA